MLDITSIINAVDVDAVDAELQALVKKFRKVQVSRFPVVAIVIGRTIKFTDSRLPAVTHSNNKQYLASVWTGRNDHGEKEFWIESRLIKNTKYKEWKSEFTRKHTKDAKKFFKSMTEYIKPFTGVEFASDSHGEVVGAFNTWKSEPNTQMCSYVDVGREALLQEVIQLTNIGVKFQTEKFQKIVEQALPLYEEHKRRKAKTFNGVHVMLQPDESVLITSTDGHPQFPKGTSTYDNMAHVPQFIFDNIALLKLVDNDTYVPEAGKKVTATEFWVESENV